MNTMKKTLVLVLALVAVIGLMTVCASAEEVEHVCAPVKVEAVEPTCHVDGHSEYYQCECGLVYASAEDKIPSNVKNFGIPATDLKYVEEVPATCEEAGVAEHYYCEKCETHFTYDDSGKLMPIGYPSLTIEPHSNLTVVEAVEPTCHSNGNIAHAYCEVCGYHETADGVATNALSVILPATGEFTTTKVEAVEPTCCKNGVAEHYVCDECGELFLDAEGTQATTLPALTISATELKFVEEVPATCETAGVAEHYYCAKCDVHYTYDESGKLMPIGYPSLTIEPHSNLTHVEAAEATCCADGNVEYYYCEVCGYAETPDGQLTNLKNVIIPATDIKYNDEVPATCEEEGIKAHWYCEKCDVYYVANDKGQRIPVASKSLTIVPHSVGLTHVEAAEATCCADGNVEYYYCEVCGYAETPDGQLTNLKNVIIPATDIKYNDEVPATCEEEGVKAHWYCEKCDVYYVANDKGQRVPVASKSLTIVPHSVGLTHVEAVAATCCRNGNVEYWYCEECGFASTTADGTELTNLKNVITPATDLVYVAEVAATATTNGMKAHYYCPVCDVYYIADDNGNMLNIARLSLVIPAYGESDIPQTGLVWWPVAALSLAGAGMIAVGAVKSKKERDEE